jgi:hypothetical protein
MAEDSPAASSTLRLTDTQRAILVALCRPRADGNRYATPATNQEIAAEVFLSVDAVKAHLRALYRKFGVEPLPHNQKRARLVELVMEGELISLPQGEEPAGDQPSQPPPPHSPPSPSDSGRGRRPSGRVLALGGGLLGAAALALILTGAFSGSSSGGEANKAITPASFRADVNENCALALRGNLRRPGASRAERASGYLAVISTMSGRLESLTPPPGNNRDLSLFRNGLTRAADYTAVIAQGPPPAGSRQSANAVAELTLAAGQVQAGALGYELGPDCSSIGRVVASSARNAALTP